MHGHGELVRFQSPGQEPHVHEVVPAMVLDREWLETIVLCEIEFHVLSSVEGLELSA